MYRGDSWTHVAVGPTCLRANFRLPSTDTGDVSTCVEQNLVHLSSSSSSLVDLNPPPRHVPTLLLSATLFVYFPFRSIMSTAQNTFLQQCIWLGASQGHQSHHWVFTVGQIKVLVLRLTLKDVGFTLGWWLWLSRLGLNESMLATLRHYTALNSFT